MTEAGSRPTVQWRHHPGLDGLRGLAVAAVVLYHGGVTFAPGGFLGVEVFFVLSGFLITSLLVDEWRRREAIALGAFWARRARRLLPALFCLVIAIGIYYTVAGTTAVIPGLEGDGIAAVLYYGNWHQIAGGAGYFAASGPVSPLQHTWSLAIEEQFYLVWPLVVGAVLWLSRRRRWSPARGLSTLLGVAAGGAVGSAVDMALLLHAGAGVDRAYYGTDTRAASLLIGAAPAIGLALLEVRRGPARPALGRAVRRAAPIALLAVLAMAAEVGGTMGWLYPAGLLGVDGAVVIVILAAVREPGCLVARALSIGPLRALGTISYGVYLWHFPLFQWLDADSIGLRGAALLGVRLAATLAVSVVSLVVIERPIRERRRPIWLIRSLAPVAAGGAVASLLIAASASSLPVGSPAAATVPQAPPGLAGTGSCQVRLTDTAAVGLAPPPPGKVARFEYDALGQATVTWSGSTTTTFETCPARKVMLVGDSLAFTLGVPMMSNEQRYGVELANASILGCSFSQEGRLEVDGSWEEQPNGCDHALQTWSAEERAFHPREVVVELGYRDEFDWRIDGQVRHLGQPRFDAYLERRIERYVTVLGRDHTKLLFLGVPYADPPDQPDGAPAPAASHARHDRIDAMLEQVARAHPRTVRYLDLDPTVSPGATYHAKIDGRLCRFDGVHFSVYCSELVEPAVLGEVRRMIG